MEYLYIWVLGIDYTQFSTVRHNEKYYTCVIDHVSSNDTEPEVGNHWKTYWVLSSFNYLPKYNQGQEFFFPFFNFTMVPPQIFSINPNSGSSCGGTNVTIIGSKFSLDAQVFFGLMVASNVVVIDPETITCTTPIHLGGGAVDVIVTQHTGASKITNGFTYTATPQIFSINPNSGSSCGGTSATITGLNFSPGDQVFFGLIEATSVVFIDCQTITCVTPMHPGGVVDVSVVQGLLMGTLTNGFTFTVTTPIISYTTQQMSVDGTQNLSATGGGGGPYIWSIILGGGTLSKAQTDSNENNLYTAPSSNANCNNNPTIQVTDFCGNTATLKIAINGAPTNQFAYALSSWTQGVSAASSCGDSGGCPGQKLATSGTGIYTTGYNCIGVVLQGTSQCTYACYLGCTSYCVSSCAIAISNAPLNPSPGVGLCPCDINSGTCDLRTPTLKTQGCCPADLL